VQGERKEPPDVTLQKRSEGCEEHRGRAGLEMQPRGGRRKAERVDRAAAYAWLARSVDQHSLSAEARRRAAGRTSAARTSALLSSANASSVYTLSASSAAAASGLTSLAHAMARAAGCCVRRASRWAGRCDRAEHGDGEARAGEQGGDEGQEANIEKNIAAEMAVRDSAHTPSDERTWM
jgi:hypothetical protein